MQGDGNCLFRSFSYLLTGSQEHHFLVRTLICNYMRSIGDLLLFVLVSGNVLDHLTNSNMTNNFVWGTDIEIYTFAHRQTCTCFVKHMTVGRCTREICQ